MLERHEQFQERSQVAFQTIKDDWSQFDNNIHDDNANEELRKALWSINLRFASDPTTSDPTLGPRANFFSLF